MVDIPRQPETLTTAIELPYVFANEVSFRLREIASLLNFPSLPANSDFEAKTLAGLDTIVAYLQAGKNKPVRIALGAPLILRNGKTIMANIQLANDEVLIIPILTDNADGMPVPPPSGDTFSVVSSSPSLASAIDTTTLVPAGTPGVKISATVQVSPGLTFTLADSAGLTSFTQGVDIVADTTPKMITLDVANEVVQAQPVPVAPGP